MPPAIRILIVDDQQLVREGLRSLLELETDFQVVGEAADGEEAVALAASLRPDLILLDLLMPVKSGVEALPEIRHRQPQARVLILTALLDQEVLVRAMQLGVAGCLLKSISPTDLVQAIRAASQDGLPLDPQVATMLVRKIHQLPAPGKAELTEREQEILALLAQGASNEAIAQALAISPYTVRSHVSHILRKLHVSNRVQATLSFLRDQENQTVAC